MLFAEVKVLIDLTKNCYLFSAVKQPRTRHAPRWYRAAADPRLTPEEISAEARRLGFRPTSVEEIRLAHEPGSRRGLFYNRAALFWCVISTRNRDKARSHDSITAEFDIRLESWMAQLYMNYQPQDANFYAPDDFDKAAESLLLRRCHRRE